MTTNQPFTAEWRAIDAARSDHPEFLLEHAYAADMIIASQSDPDWDRSPFLDCPERLVLGSGRPVLLVPYIGNYREIGRNVVIAWKPGREGARAAFDALPILRTAKSIHVLQVAEADGALPIGASAIATALARHGFKAEVQTSPVSETDVGNEILSRLSDLDADLLVMGAYGHSRLREYVFGGATRQIMQHMTVPTLFSH